MLQVVQYRYARSGIAPPATHDTRGDLLFSCNHLFIAWDKIRPKVRFCSDLCEIPTQDISGLSIYLDHYVLVYFIYCHKSNMSTGVSMVRICTVSKVVCQQACRLVRICTVSDLMRRYLGYGWQENCMQSMLSHWCRLPHILAIYTSIPAPERLSIPSYF